MIIQYRRTESLKPGDEAADTAPMSRFLVATVAYALANAGIAAVAAQTR
jgi:hypothetical protein